MRYLDVVSRAAEIKQLAAANLVTFGGDSVFSMGGRGVDCADVAHALCNAVSVDDRGSYVLVTGPAVDGSELRVVAKVNGRIKVSDVCL